MAQDFVGTLQEVAAVQLLVPRIAAAVEKPVGTDTVSQLRAVENLAA